MENGNSSSTAAGGSSADSNSCGLTEPYLEGEGTNGLPACDISRRISGDEGRGSGRREDGVLDDGSSSVRRDSGRPASKSNSMVNDSRSQGRELLVVENEDMGGSSSSSRSGRIPTGDAACRSTGEEDRSIGHRSGSRSRAAAAAAAAGAVEGGGADAETGGSCGGKMDVDGEAGEDGHEGGGAEEVEEEEEGQGGDEGDLYAEDDEERDTTTEKKQPWRGVLGIDDLLTQRDDEILELLSEQEPVIPDELCRYFLHRVGCATADSTVVRLISVAAQLQMERVIDDAKVFAAGMQQAAATAAASGSAAQRTRRARGAAKDADAADESHLNEDDPENVDELDIGSLCAALQKNDDTFSGLSLDCFLDAAPVFVNAEAGASAELESEPVAEAADPRPMRTTANAAVKGSPVASEESGETAELNTTVEAANFPAAAVCYESVGRSSVPLMQPASTRTTSSCEGGGPRAPSQPTSSRPEPMYTAPGERFAMQGAVRTTAETALYGGVVCQARPLPTRDVAGTSSGALMEQSHCYSGVPPATADLSSSSLNTVLPISVAMTADDVAAAAVSRGLAPEASSTVPVDATGDLAGSEGRRMRASGTAAGMASRTALPAGAVPGVAAGAVPFNMSFGGVMNPLGAVTSGPGSPPTAAVAFGSTLQSSRVLQSAQGGNCASPAAATPPRSVAAGGPQAAAGVPRGEGSAAVLSTPVSVDAGRAAAVLPAGVTPAARGVAVQPTVGGAGFSSTTLLFPPTRDAAPQLSPAAAAPALATAATGGAPAAAALLSAAGEAPSHAHSGATSARGFPVDSGSTFSSSRLATSFSVASAGTSADAAALESAAARRDPPWGGQPAAARPPSPGAPGDQPLFSTRPSLSRAPSPDTSNISPRYIASPARATRAAERAAPAALAASETSAGVGTEGP